MIRNTFKTFFHKLRAAFHHTPPVSGNPPPHVVTIPDVIRPSADAKRRRRARVPKVVRLLRTRQGETSGHRNLENHGGTL